MLNCEGHQDLYHQKADSVIISSIFFDFFPGFISLWFTLKLYECIDIDHPVYSIIFSNNLLSTLLSGFTLIIKVIATQVESCIPNFILIEISSCVFSMNYICWMCVAFLRYYLLVVVKGENNTNDINVDMIKLKTIASVCFWGTILGTSIVRFSLDLMRYLQVLSITVRNITRSILFLVYPISTFGIYYKMDVSLRVTNRGTGNKKQNQIGKNSISKKSSVSIPNQVHLESPAISIANYDTGVGTRGLGPRTKFDSTSKAIIIFSTPKRRKNRIGCIKKISPDAIEKPFGGIYVGDDKQTTENDTEDLDISSVTNVAGTAKSNMKNDAQSISSILVDADERPMKYSTIKAEINSPKTVDITSSKKHDIQETRRPEFQNIETLSVTKPENHPSDTTINRIDVLKHSENESVTNLGTTARGNGSKGTKNDLNGEEEEEEEEEEDDDDDYHQSKEHKSILKAALVNCLYIGLMLIMGGMLTIISKENISDGVIMMLGLMLSFYRTFAPIISSIYCFEVIRACSLNYLNEKQDNFRAAYNMLRGLCR